MYGFLQSRPGKEYLNPTTLEPVLRHIVARMEHQMEQIFTTPYVKTKKTKHNKLKVCTNLRRLLNIRFLNSSFHLADDLHDFGIIYLCCHFAKLEIEKVIVKNLSPKTF